MTDHTAIDTGLLILRVVLGLTMAAHGHNKFFGKGGLAGVSTIRSSAAGASLKPTGTGRSSTQSRRSLHLPVL